jgi:hypothetical protein
VSTGLFIWVGFRSFLEWKSAISLGFAILIGRNKSLLMPLMLMSLMLWGLMPISLLSWSLILRSLMLGQRPSAECSLSRQLFLDL